MADVGSAAKCDADGAPTLNMNHVPLSLLPYPKPATEQQRENHLSALRRLRPDALRVSQGSSKIKSATKITIIEVKYCIDTKPEDQMARAREQHQELIRRLIEAGYSARNISICPLLVGVSGTIYKRTIKALKSLGVAHTHATTCTAKLHTEAIRSLHDIVKTRRHLEHTSNSKDNPPKPP